jgi:hypothetical protein
MMSMKPFDRNKVSNSSKVNCLPFVKNIMCDEGDGQLAPTRALMKQANAVGNGISGAETPTRESATPREWERTQADLREGQFVHRACSRLTPGITRPAFNETGTASCG